MYFLQIVQDPMYLNNLSCNITDKMYMYNCIPMYIYSKDFLVITSLLFYINA